MARRAEQVFRALTLVCMGCMALAAIITAADPLRRFSELAQIVVSVAYGLHHSRRRMTVRVRLFETAK